MHRNKIFLAPLAAAALLASSCGGARPKRPDIVLITVESLRTDHMGFLGERRPTTPHMDELAEQSTVYTDAQATTSWTLTSHASIFTGLYPTAHQTTGAEDRLDDSYTTLAEELSAAGYQTAGVVSGPYLRRPYNLDQGFEYYDQSPSSVDSLAHHSRAFSDVTSPRMLASLERFLEKDRDPKRPLFLFAYFWDPHWDYIPPEPYKSMFVEPGDEPVPMAQYKTNPNINVKTSPAQIRYVVSQYDGEIRWTDEYIGRFLDDLKQRGLWDDTLVILTADHGEEFFDHGFKGHKNNLYEETVHVPLLVKYPGRGPRGRDGRPVSLVDLFPTVLDASGIAHPDGLDGVSLLRPVPADRPRFSELLVSWFFPSEPKTMESVKVGSEYLVAVQWYGVRRDGFQLVSVPSSGIRQLFDLTTDPRERHNVAAAHPDLLEDLTRLQEDWLGRLRDTAALYHRGGPANLEEKEIERLRSLGYVK